MSAHLYPSLLIPLGIIHRRNYFDSMHELPK
jgi:hypothetical protein